LVDVSPDQGIALFDAQTGILQINSFHPFVAYFLDDYEDAKRNLPLELLAMAEVLLEAQLLALGLKEDVIHDALTRRDVLLRHLAKSCGK
jgi:hypothetical protein